MILTKQGLLMTGISDHSCKKNTVINTQSKFITRWIITHQQQIIDEIKIIKLTERKSLAIMSNTNTEQAYSIFAYKLNSLYNKGKQTLCFKFNFLNEVITVGNHCS